MKINCPFINVENQILSHVDKKKNLDLLVVSPIYHKKFISS